MVKAEKSHGLMVEAILQNMPYGVFVVEVSDLVVKYCNSKAVEDLGLIEEEIVDQLVCNVFDTSVFKELRTKLKDSSNSENIRVAVKGPATSEDKVVSIDASVIRTESSKLFLCIIRDVYAKSLKKEVEDLKEGYEFLMKGLSVGVWDWNIETGTEFWTESFKEILGIVDPLFEPTLDEFTTRLHPEDKSMVLDAVDAHFKDKKKYDIEFRMMHESGSYIWIHACGQAKWNDEGKPVRMLGSIMDVSLRKRVEEELIRSHKELDQFAYISSHDLREPLRGIRNYVTFISEDYEDKLDDAGKQKLQMLTVLTKRLEDFIASLLEYSRLSRAEGNFSKNNIGAIVQEVVDLISISKKEQGVSIIVSNDLPIVECDSIHMAQLYKNLISNSIKYNQNDSKKIEIGCESCEGVEVFYVKDNGIGIREKDYELVFQIFKRLHGRSSFGGGIGAGLTIAKKIIELHGGSIWIDSTLGKGTVIYFTLKKVPQTIISKYQGLMQNDSLDKDNS